MHFVLENDAWNPAPYQTIVLCCGACRDIPPSIHPFSKGVFHNLYLACCLPEDIVPIYLVPSMSRLCARTMWSSLSRG